MSVYRPKDRNGRPKSPHWHYDFVLDGRRFSGSTGETTRAAAERVERLRREEAARPRDDTTIDGAFALWWEERGRHDSGADTTFARLERLQDVLGAVLDADGLPHELGSIATRHLAEYAARRRRQLDRRGRLPSPSTVNRELQVLRRVMRHAFDVWEKPLRLPRFGAALAPEPDPRARGIPTDVLAALRASLREDYRPAFDWLTMVGARAGNALATERAVHLRPSDVDLDARAASWRVKSRRPGGRLVTIPLSTAMVALLATEMARHDRTDAVFTYAARATRRTPANGTARIRGERYPITKSAFQSAFKRAAAEIGRPELRVHDLRHTAGTNILRSTGNLAITQALLGHAQVTTTLRYAHVMHEDLAVALEARDVALLERVTDSASAPAVAGGAKSSQQ